MSSPDAAIISELRLATDSLAAAVDAVRDSDMFKAEVALAEVQERVGRILREIEIIQSKNPEADT